MKRGDRILSIVWGGLQLLWGIINLPLVLFGALMSLVRTLIGLLLFGLGIFAYDFYTEYQARGDTRRAGLTNAFAGSGSAVNAAFTLLMANPSPALWTPAGCWAHVTTMEVSDIDSPSKKANPRRKALQAGRQDRSQASRTGLVIA